MWSSAIASEKPRIKLLALVSLAMAATLPVPTRAQAQGTYSYSGPPLQLLAGPADKCPAKSVTVTATVTANASGQAGPVSGTLSGGGYTVPINNAFSLVVSQGPPSSSVPRGIVLGASLSGAIYPNNNRSSFPTVQVGASGPNGAVVACTGNVGDTVIIPATDYPAVNDFCEYGAAGTGPYVCGTWSSGPQVQANNLGAPGPPASPAQQSSPANPAVANTDLGCATGGVTSPTPSCLEGNPINAGTGNKVQIEQDFAAAPHTGLSLIRYYNSQDTTSTAFGTNWHSTWHHGLNVASDGSNVTAIRADGRQDVFTNNGAGAYTANPDVRDRLVRVPAAGSLAAWQLAKADDSIETYTPTGLLISITTRAGLVTSLLYDGGNRLVRVTGPFGHTLTFVYDSNGHVSQMTVPDGSAYRYLYSASGNLVAVAYPSGVQRQYLYENANSPNALTGVIDENGSRFATFTYDAQGRATSTQHAGGAGLTTVIYNSDGSSTITDANGNQHSLRFTNQFGLIKIVSLSGAPVPAVGGNAFAYDANGFIASRTDYDGNVTTYTHDARGNETSRTMAANTSLARTISTAWHPTFHLPTQITDGNQLTSFTYDAKGNLVARTVTGPNVVSTWSYTYNGAGQVLTATDPRGNVTSYTYDAQGDVDGVTNALGHVTSLLSYDANGRPVQIHDPNGLVTSLTYNFRGQITSRTEAQWTTARAYDAAGQLTQVTRPDRSFRSFSYDAAHQLASITDSLGDRIVYTLDAASNRIRTQIFTASGVPTWMKAYAYDNVDRLTQEIGAVGQTRQFSYDANGNLTRVTDPLAHTTVGGYDALNRLIGIVDPNGGTVGFGYDTQSRVAAVTDPRGLTTSYTYDGLNDPLAIRSPDSGVTTKTYDAAGNVITSTDERGKKSVFSYDALNRLTKSVFADGSAINYAYDQGANGKGRLTSMIDPGGTTTWVYDVHGRVTAKQQTAGAVTLTTSQTYNAVTGQRASVTYPSGSAILFTYDADGRVSALSHKRPEGQTAILLSQIAHQPFGPVVGWRLGNGTSYSRLFDQDGRITQLTLPSGEVIALAYDASSRIISIAETGLPTKAFGYDALDRITGYASGAVTQTYTYDASGNRVGRTSKDGHTTTALTYSYDRASNRLLGITGNGRETFTYDANGNMLSHTSPFAEYSFTNDARNRRSKAYVGAIATTDVINGLGQRTVQIHGDTEHFVYDGAGRIIGSYDNFGRRFQETVWLADLPVAVLSGPEQFYVSPDHLGAPHQITEQNGRAVWQWDHDPFGSGVPPGRLQYDLRFPGQIYDREVRLHYNYFRDYDPNTGRYIESDPFGLGGGVNTYAYVGNNPLRLIDPWGWVGYTPPGADPVLCAKYECKCATGECAAGLSPTPEPTAEPPWALAACEVGSGAICKAGLGLPIPPLWKYGGFFICEIGTSIGCALLYDGSGNPSFDPRQCILLDNDNPKVIPPNAPIPHLPNTPIPNKIGQ